MIRDATNTGKFIFYSSVSIFSYFHDINTSRRYDDLSLAEKISFNIRQKLSETYENISSLKRFVFEDSLRTMSLT